MQRSQNNWLSRQFTRRAALFLIGSSLAFSTSLTGCNSRSDKAPDKSSSPNSSAVSSPSASTSSNQKEIRIVRSKQLAALAVWKNKEH